jgi:hypothetical protein
MSELSGVSPDDQAAADAANLAAESRAEGNPTPEPTERPEWCPEKFARFNDDGTFNASMSATELSKAHGGLEARFTQSQQDDLTEDDLEEQDNAPDDDLPAAEHEPITNEEFWDGLTTEFNETGELSAESRAIVRDLGIPEAMIDDYIAGQSARGDQYHDGVVSILGDNGAEDYEILVDWASSGGMTAEEADVFNAAVTSGDRHRAQVAIRDLKTQYIAAEGSFDTLAVGGGTGGGQQGVQPFASRYEQSAAINDPRYSRDKAYRQSVEARMDISDFN